MIENSFLVKRYSKEPFLDDGNDDNGGDNDDVGDQIPGILLVLTKS